MKKLGILLLAAALAVCGLAVFSACDEPEHTHSFGDWKVVAEPACTEEGLRERVCTCGEKESEEIEALGHTPSEAIKENEVAATCTADGSYEEVVYCAVCGEELSRKAVEVTALGHDYVKGVCVRCGEAEPYTEGLIFEFSGDGASYTVTGYKGTSTEVYIPSYYQGLPVTSIGDSAFYGCDGLTSVTIGDGVTTMGDGVFGWCSSLTSITIPDGVTSIGDYAFSSCSGLESITIPDSVISIGDGVFGGCSGLTNIFVDPQNPVYHSTGSHLIATKSKSLIAVCRGSMIPTDGSVTSIGADTFMACIWLESIIIPDSVTFIGEAAFGGCSRLTNISVDPQNPVYHSTGSHLIETKSKSLIAVCRGSMIPTDGSVTSIGDGAFMDCAWLESILIPDSVTSIRGEAFYGCSGLTSITIPDSVTSIGGGAFQGCSNLDNIVVPDSVTSIGGNAFTGTAFYNDRSNWDRNMLYLGGHLIKAEESSSGNYSIREGTIYIAGSAFMSCNLRSIIIPNSVVSIGDSAFMWCHYLKSLVIPDSVTYIGLGAFEGCSSLTSITIPDSVTTIGNCVFSGCDSLTSVTIPDSVTYIGESAFSGCSSLTSITVNEGNPVYHSDGNCLIETQSKTLIAGCLSSVVPADGSVTSIGNYAFLLCRDLTSITIPWGVASIGKVAFANCYNLTSIVIPDSVTFIDYGAFAGCESLETVYYTGSEAEWNEIEIGVSNGNLLNANIIFNYTGE